MTLGWSVCCYLHGLLPDQLFKHGVVIHSEVSEIIKPLFLSVLLTYSIIFLSGGYKIGADHPSLTSLTERHIFI